MMTPSRIGTMNKDGSIRYVYCHEDGNPGFTGMMLLDHYNTQKKVDGLLDMGDMSTLDETIDKSLFYHRDHNVPWLQAQPAIVETMEEFLDLGEEEYVYFFKDGVWYVADAKHKKFHALDLSGKYPDDVEAMPVAEDINELI